MTYEEKRVIYVRSKLHYRYDEICKLRKERLAWPEKESMTIVPSLATCNDCLCDVGKMKTQNTKIKKHHCRYFLLKRTFETSQKQKRLNSENTSPLHTYPLPIIMFLLNRKSCLVCTWA